MLLVAFPYRRSRVTEVSPRKKTRDDQMEPNHIGSRVQKGPQESHLSCESQHHQKSLSAQLQSTMLVYQQIWQVIKVSLLFYSLLCRWMLAVDLWTSEPLVVSSFLSYSGPKSPGSVFVAPCPFLPSLLFCVRHLDRRCVTFGCKVTRRQAGKGIVTQEDTKRVGGQRRDDSEKNKK